MEAKRLKRRSTPKPQRVYFDILGVPDATSLVEKIVSVVMNQVREKPAAIPPVSLAPTASDFLIDPRPIHEDLRGDGKLGYDNNRGRFVITLGRKSALRQCSSGSTTVVSSAIHSEPWSDLTLTPRGRFTYAHELAHRFFFIKRDSGWVRALDLALQQINPAQRFRAQRILTTLEESLCNRIARRVLVPDDLFLGAIQNGELGTRAISPEKMKSVPQLIRGLAQVFAVSSECIIVKLQKAASTGLISFPEAFCLLLIGESNMKGNSDRSRWDIRVKTAILPERLGGLRLQPMFIGMSVQNLGEEAAHLLHRVLKEPDVSPRGKLRFPLLLKSSTAECGTEYISAELYGFWNRFAGRDDYQGGVVWGLLQLS